MNDDVSVLKTAFGELCLDRLPVQKIQPLRAWDAADEYLLAHLHDSEILKDDSRILVINDGFGALSASLNHYEIHNWSDSLLSYQAYLHNAKKNSLESNITLVRSVDEPKGTFDIVLIKIPKTLGLLEDLLIRLKPHLHGQSDIISAGMVKHLPKTALGLLEKIVGPTRTSLAKKKARLAFTQFTHADSEIGSPYPRCYFEPTVKLELCHHANVFSKDRLDIGSRFLLEQFKQLPQKTKIVDLGCGNGVLGIVAQQLQPDAELVFLDESYMAVASAEINYKKAFPQGEAQFIASDCLSEFEGSADLILCNPPFHQQHSVGDFIAWQMFTQSSQKLRSGGELWVVGNRHMQYHSKLKKLFGTANVIASNKKFVVIRAIKR